jgi:DNA-binding MarR family transcriptional regulator
MAVQPAQITDYLDETLGVRVVVRPWAARNRLPIFLKQAYDFYVMDILGHECLAIVDRASDEVSPATIRKHTEHLRDKFPGDVIYVRDRVAAYQRKRLIEQRVPFIVPGNQLYLPSFGIDLREFYRSQLRETPEAFSPATQAVLLYLLLQAPAGPHTPNELAKRLGYSKMSMSRVLQELEGRPFARTETVGRNRLLTIADDRQRVWNEALPFLRNPAIKRCHVSRPNNPIGGVSAGLSALSHYTMLSAAPPITVAMTAARWRMIQKSLDLKPASPSDTDTITVEVWSYDPLILAEDKFVDRLSLYLSLRETSDERIEVALTEMMETLAW